MAQQMRIRDQEIIVKKVVQALEEKGLQDLETRFGNDSQVKFVKDLVKDLITIKKKVDNFKEQEAELEQSIRRSVEDFNTVNGFKKETTGLHANTGRYSRQIDKNQPYFEFKLSWDKRTDIADELAMQTLGSEVNAQDLIANLIAQFSK